MDGIRPTFVDHLKDHVKIKIKDYKIFEMDLKKKVPGLTIYILFIE